MTSQHRTPGRATVRPRWPAKSPVPGAIRIEGSPPLAGAGAVTSRRPRASEADNRRHRRDCTQYAIVKERRSVLAGRPAPPCSCSEPPLSRGVADEPSCEASRAHVRHDLDFGPEDNRVDGQAQRRRFIFSLQQRVRGGIRRFWRERDSQRMACESAACLSRIEVFASRAGWGSLRSPPTSPLRGGEAIGEVRPSRSNRPGDLHDTQVAPGERPGVSAGRREAPAGATTSSGRFAR